MEADAEVQTAPASGGAHPHVGDLFRHRRRRFAPGEVDIQLFGGEFVGGGGISAEIQRRVGVLHRRKKHLSALDAQMPALKIYGLPGEHAAPDVQEFVGNSVALVVVQEQAIAGQFHWITACDDIDQQPSVGEPVEGGGHPRRQTRRRQPRPDCHQKAQPFRDRNQAGGHDPRIFAGPSGGE